MSRKALAAVWASVLLAFLCVAGRAEAQSPQIAGTSPTLGGVGASVWISGSNFGSAQGSSTVTFNGVTATASSWSATGISAAVPSGATTGNIVVTVSGIASNGTEFNVVTTPQIAGTSPTQGGVGASVWISGSNFRSAQGSSTVSFNGVPATPASWSNTGLSAPVPPGATTGNIVVTVGGVASNGSGFSVVATPQIAGTSPTQGGVGASVWISGSDFWISTRVQHGDLQRSDGHGVELERHGYLCGGAVGGDHREHCGDGERNCKQWYRIQRGDDASNRRDLSNTGGCGGECVDQRFELRISARVQHSDLQWCSGGRQQVGATRVLACQSPLAQRRAISL